MNLRDDLLRTLAKREAKSLHKIEEEKKALPIESYNRHRTRRRSTIVTDVLKEVTPPKEAKEEPKDRKPSLVTDVIKFFQKKKERRDSLIGAPQPHPQPRPETQPQSQPGGHYSRFKEILELKYTSAAKAAKMAFKEARISMQANRRLSPQAPDHYLTSANTKFANWRKKFQVGLKQDT